MDGIVLDLRPPLGRNPYDGQMNLMWEITLEPKDICEIVVVHTYGASQPLVGGLPTPACVGNICKDNCDVDCSGNVDAFDIEPFLELLFGEPDPCCEGAGDADGNGTVDAFDIEPFLTCLFGP